MKLIICDSCQGKNNSCPVCHGQSVGLSFNNYFFSWQKKLTSSNIYLERFLRLVRKFVIFLLYVFVLVVLLGFLFFYYKFLLAGGDFFDFFAKKNILLQLFWLAILVALYLFYRLSSHQVSEKLVVKKLANFLNEELNIVQEPWPTNSNSLKNVDISRAFDYQSLKIIEKSFLLAEGRGQILEPAHIFYILMQEKKSQNYFFRLNIKTSIFQERLERFFADLEKASGLSVATKTLFLTAYLEAYASTRQSVTLEELLISLSVIEGPIKDLLIEYEIDENKIRQVVAWKRIQEKIAKHWQTLQTRAATKPKHEINRSYTAVVSPFLDQFSEDLTQLARVGSLEPTFGREKELATLFNYFNTGKDGVILVGQRGAGKSFVVESLAELMAAEEVPSLFQDKRLVRLSVPALIAGADSSGAIELRLLAILKEVSRAGNIILVIDNIEALIGLGTESSAAMDLATVLAEELEKKYFLLIAISDQEKYNTYLKNSSLSQILAVVPVNEPEAEAVMRILEVKTSFLEKKYQVFFSYQALEKIIDLTTKYIRDQFLPVKAINVLNEIASWARQNKGVGALVSEEDVANVISTKVKIPLAKVTASESQKLLNLEEEMHLKIVDQVEAVVAVAEALRRARTNLNQDKKPIASFLFLGPTGVGKTEVARVLSEIYFDGAEHFIRLDMSEYSGFDAVEKLIGSVGSPASGYLINQIKDKPFALVLLDEFEKATSEVHNLFLQVMEDGRLTAASGETVDFSHTIIIATSNVGTDLIQQRLKSGQNMSAIKQELLENKLSDFFRIELLNRFDGLVVFKPLAMSEVHAITKLLLNKLRETLVPKGIVLEYTDQAVQEIALAGFDATLGARPLRRVIQDKIENQIAKLILAKEVTRRDKIILNSLTDIQVQKAKQI